MTSETVETGLNLGLALAITKSETLDYKYFSQPNNSILFLFFTAKMMGIWKKNSRTRAEKAINMGIVCDPFFDMVVYVV